MKRFYLLAPLLFLGSWSSTRAQEPAPDAAQIIARSQQAMLYQGRDMKARIEMRLIDKKGRSRQRSLTMLRVDQEDGGNQRYFMYFHAPADVRGMTFLIHKDPSVDDDRWIFVPSLDLIRRIASDDKRSSFVGSDFTYEDVSGRDVASDEHRLLERDTLDGRECFVVESVPRDFAEYARRRSWIDAETFLPLKEEYFDAQGELFKVYTSHRVERIPASSDSAESYATVLERKMENVKTGHTTEVRFESVTYDNGLLDEEFEERYLRRPPPSWIR